MDFCMDFSLLWCWVCIWRIALTRRWEWWLKSVSPLKDKNLVLSFWIQMFAKLEWTLLVSSGLQTQAGLGSENGVCETWNGTWRIKKGDGNFGQGAFTAGTSVSLSVLMRFLVQAKMCSLEPFGLGCSPFSAWQRWWIYTEELFPWKPPVKSFLCPSVTTSLVFCFVS